MHNFYVGFFVKPGEIQHNCEVTYTKYFNITGDEGHVDLIITGIVLIFCKVESYVE